MTDHLQRAKTGISEVMKSGGDPLTNPEGQALAAQIAVASALIAIAEVEKEKSITLGAMNVNLAVITEQLEKANKLKFFELRGNENFKLKPSQILSLFELMEDK